MDIQIIKVVSNYPNDVLQSIWEESHPDLDSKKRIRWAYKENICGKAQLWLLKCQTTGDYFGCSAIIPRYFFIKGKKILGALIADTGVKKKYRSLGPVLKLHKKIIKRSQNFSLILAFPNEISQAVIKVVGFKDTANLINYVKIIRSRVVIREKIKNPFLYKLLLPLALIIDLGLKLLDFRLGRSNYFVGRHLKNFDKNFDEIWEKIKAKFDFIVDRNSRYLNWRYKKNPNKDYNIYAVYGQDSQDLLGYAIYYIKNNWVYVDDFLWLEVSLKLETLLYLFIRMIRKKKVDLIRFRFIDNSLINKAFRKMRFIKWKPSPIMYFSFDNSLNEIFPSLIKKAFVTSGDRDF